MTFFDLQLSTRASLHTDGDPDLWVSEYDGIIMGENDDGEVTEVGRLKAQRVHVEIASRHGEPLFDICDCHSDELHVLHTLLFQPDSYFFRSRLHDRFDITAADLLVFDYVVVDPKWRGLKLGLLAVRRLLDVISGGCGLVVTRIAPLRRQAHEELGVPARWVPANKTKEDIAAATVKLRKHFRKLGFERLGRTPFYVLPANELTPTADSLLNEKTKA